MIKNIEKLKEQSLKYIKEFLEGCEIEEKIDTHYITVDIITKNEIKINKANGNEIDRVDLILNSMWSKLVFDWNYLKISNAEWFANHVGYSMKFFYFPCDTPILTTYDGNIRYVFDSMTYGENIINIEQEIKSLKFPSAYKIGFKHKLNKVKGYKAMYPQLDESYENNTPISDIVLSMIDKDGLYAKDPEGYIFKYNKRIYQIILNRQNRKIDSDKAFYEFLLADFIKYCRNSNYTEKITPSYTVTVCNLFNDYIINNEKRTNYIENNIDASGLEAPYLGTKFDISYEVIPDQITKNICQESELYKNIFKILLASLRKGKDMTKCDFLSKKEVDEWNNIMKSIKIRNVYI